MGFRETEGLNKFGSIPDEMKQYSNWICWKAVPDERSHSGIRKIPIDAKSGKAASSTGKDTWSDFDTAVSAASRYSGIAFVFTDSPYFGVDLDDMPEDIEDFKNGGSSNRIAEFVHTLKSYAEYSQSGNGIHIICRGSLPPGRRKSAKYEMYETGRYFIMTGSFCGGYTDIADCTVTVKPLHEKYLGGGREPKPRVPAVSVALSVNEIIEKALNAKNGDKFARLYSGDISEYGSQSEADMALCNLLAFWTCCDAEKMDAIFRTSGLMREKWDRRQSGTTYGAITIAKAVAECGSTYSPEFSVNSSGISIKSSGTSTHDKGDKTPTETDVKHYSLDDMGRRVAADGSAEALCGVEADRRAPRYSLDDMGNAARFVDFYGANIRYSYTDKRWLYYDGRKWCTDLSGTAERLADCAVKSMRAEAKAYIAEFGEDGDMTKAFQKHMKQSRSHKAKENMLKEVRHSVPIMPVQLDRYKMALNTPSGLLNLKSGELYEHKAEYYLTKITNVEYSENADCPLWLNFLNEIFGGDLDLIRYVQKAVGYTLTGSTREQCAFFLYGTGRNGKSTFLDIIRDILGDYATNVQPETLMVKSNTSSAINSDIARLKGARLVTSVEPNEGVRINEGLLKQLTGDDPVTARKLYSEEFEFKPEFKLWMATNHKPIIRGTDTGIWRRIHMIPFTVQIPEEKVDKNLRHKLKSELTGIFKWCLDGCLLWQREGLKMPLAVLESVSEYRREMDVISAFIEDRCELSGAVQASVLYACYAQWAQDNNEYCMSATKFGVELAKRFEKIKTSKGQVFYNGISLI